MDDKFKDIGTNDVSTQGIGQVVDELVRSSESARRSHERRWYDNNFFDDGHHFRYVSRTTNKIIDQSERATIYSPQRAIPKASRQIRGVANLLLSQNPVPTVYPERVLKQDYPQQMVQDPQSGQPIDLGQLKYQKAEKEAKDRARKSGWWLRREFESQDMIEKLALMAILAAKHSVSWIQIWPDLKGKISSQVYDAFDLYTVGELTDPRDEPYMIKVVPQLISDIINNENYDEAQRMKVVADNKKASSQIKAAYMNSRFGGEFSSSRNATGLLQEGFLKEVINESNIYRISQQDNASQVLQGKEKGDTVIRQVCSVGGIWLSDQYTTLREHPFIDYRMEPGPIYQVPLIERFIPANKSLDLIVSRLERISNTMIGGIWLKRQGEQFEMSNSSAGLTVEYSATKPEQAQMTPIPSYPFNLIGLLEQFIEEQGVTTSTLGKIPPGVRANSAIESLKESEYSTLTIATRRMRQTVKRIAERMLEIADDYCLKPQTVYAEEKGVSESFDVMGQGAMNRLQGLGVSPPAGVIPLKKDYRVDVTVEAGMAYTKEGQKATMLDLVDRLILFAREGYVAPQAVKVVLEKFLQVYQFGNVSEFMEAMDDFQSQGNLADQQIKEMKVAMIEVFKDLITKGVLPDQKTRITENKVAIAEVMKDVGGGGGGQAATKPPSESISFKDLPPSGKTQMAAKVGIEISEDDVQAKELADKAVDIAKLSISAKQKKEVKK